MAKKALWVAAWLAINLAGCTKHTDSAATPQVAIIGGGVAGLTTAYMLQKQGISSHILEERPVFGGRVATANYGHGQTGEYGMQEMWADSPLVAIAKELDVPMDEGDESAFSSMILEGKLEPFPGDTTESYFAGMFDANTRQALNTWRNDAAQLYRRAKDKGLADPNVAHLQDVSLLAWLQEAGLPARAQQWVRNTVEVEMATDAADTSALAALLEMEMFFDAGMHDYHVKGGNSQLIDAMVKAVRGPKSLGATVSAVHKVGKGFEVRYEQDHVVRTLHAQRVVVAVPFYRLHQVLFDPPLPVDVWQAINSMHLGQYTVVHFLTDAGARALWTHNNATPFPVLAGSELGSIYGPMRQGANDAGDVFSILLYGARAKSFHMLPRETKIAEVKAQVDALWPGFAQHVHDAYVYTYHPTSLPVWPPGRSSIDGLAQELRSGHDGVYLVGDYTRGAHATGAALSGVWAADHIVQEWRDSRR